MKLYDRDYTVLTEEELMYLAKIQKTDGERKFGRKNSIREYPPAIRHYMSLFPNNYLDFVELTENPSLGQIVEAFRELIEDESVGEREILKWFKETRAYFIIGSIMKANYSFGHHDAYVFPEFQLGNSYAVDFLIVGKSSGGHEFIFVELEAPRGKATLASGYLGESMRKGENQVNDWKRYIAANFSSIYETFNKYKHPHREWPTEFLKSDPTRFHYVVVAGMRSDFTDTTYEQKRDKAKQGVLLMHYENLLDFADSIIGEATY